VKRDLRQLLLTLDEGGAQRLFRLLRQPKYMDPDAFVDLVAHEKLAARYSTWSRQKGLGKEHLGALVAARRTPAAVRRWARSQLEPPTRIATATRLGSPPRIYTREELHEAVWSEPITVLSKRFGLSDNGLRKRCRNMNVPTPPVGYWQKAKKRGGAKRIPLPPIRT